MPYSRALVFDFDGTLADSFEANLISTNDVLRLHGFPEIDAAELVHGMQYETTRRFAHHSGTTDPDLAAQMEDDYFRAIANHMDAILPESGAFDLIREYRRRGVPTAIVSNNRGNVVRNLLDQWGHLDAFDAVIGDGDGIPVKPSPAGIASILGGLGIPAWRAAYVGDGAGDAETATAAGVYSIGVSFIHARHGIPASEDFPRMLSTVDDLSRAIETWLARMGTDQTRFAKQKQLYFVRHCESEANAADVLASHQDSPLSSRGREQAEAVARAFQHRHPVDAVWTSPLLRARQTADAIARAVDLPVAPVDSVIEQDLGVFSGMTFSEVADRIDYEHDRTRRWNWKPDGGESYQEVYERVVDFFLETVANSPHERIAVVTHAVTMRLIRAFLENSAPRYPESIARNGEIWDVTFERPGAVHEIRSHLVY